MARLAAFTTRYTGRARTIVTDVRIYPPFDPRDYVGKVEPENKVFRAIWDTGATNSVIASEVVNSLELKPTGLAQVATVGGETVANVFLINLKLPNDVGFAGLPVTEGTVKNANVLIGMDVIAQGDFAITNKDGITWMTFHLPSTRRLDFVKEINDLKVIRAAKGKVGRNDPCPCGSGNKYKHCHGA